MKRKSVKSKNPWRSVILTSYDIIKAHEGNISVESGTQKGTTFTIQLPAHKKP